ncbi:osmoprotectant uptake system permease [Litchfieldella qijiaojingensis]|uniref:Osmoprotectant uptake system permease n=1 Tax=Litchfieldella qijiaojingensis TaxID=980347 RepID=A0ABQ2YBM3_9GAMM|nr:ABC transporter permease [Halomonas qijiaojingensis]GGX78296.1 osmoprotectant uptake system permease [Halomonas qijiaojingensis]
MSDAMQSPNRVIVALTTLALLVLHGLELVSVQPNRIVPGEAYRLGEIMGPFDAVLLSLPLLAGLWLAWHPTVRRLRLLLGLDVALLIALPWALAAFSLAFVDSGQPYARAGIGAGVWSLLFLLLLILIELRTRLNPTRGALLLVGGLVLGSLTLALVSGWLDTLALLREYASRREQFTSALLYHLWLVGAAVSLSLVIGFALALTIRSFTRLQTTTFGVLSVIQTIPSLALFGLLLAPLAWLAARYPLLAELGVQGIGWTPALIALVGYSLLPMTRNTFVALEEVPPDVIEAARGMGMSPWQIFFQVRLPLGLPVLLEGIRVTTIQAVGLAAVAALIGAGGLGTFIFQGLGQAAMDLVVLGALPILVMALIVDAGFSALAAYFRRGVVHD